MISTLRADEQHQHRNGLGWVANTARVEPSVYVGPYALVYGSAELTERVRVEGTARVSGHAQLSGDVLVCGNRWIDGTFKANTGTYRVNEKRETKAVRLRPAEDGL
jgi:UDP-3-O-[3-hydroxymyristoyl] glucosamine N-acyltransferase